MTSQLDVKFFRKAKKVNRAVEITDNYAIIPAVKDSAEVRVPLPNRRLKTIEERQAEQEERLAKLTSIEEQVEIERKGLLDLIKVYRQTKTGAANVVIQNLKVKELMEQRSRLVRPEKWIEELDGLSFKDIFASKRDDRKIGSAVLQVKRRVEPISSLYVDLGAEADKSEVVAEEEKAPEPAASVLGLAPPAKSAAEVAQGVIIGKRVLTKKKSVAPGGGP
jgi:hypothetical protein